MFIKVQSLIITHKNRRCQKQLSFTHNWQHFQQTNFFKSTLEARFGDQTFQVCGLQARLQNVGQIRLPCFSDLCGWSFDDRFGWCRGLSWRCAEVLGGYFYWLELDWMEFASAAPIDSELYGDWILYSKWNRWIQCSLGETFPSGLLMMRQLPRNRSKSRNV